MTDADQHEILLVVHTLVLQATSEQRRIGLLSIFACAAPWVGLSIALRLLREERHRFTCEEIRQVVVAVDSMLDIVTATPGDRWHPHREEVVEIIREADGAELFDELREVATEPRFVEVVDRARTKADQLLNAR